MIQGDLEFAKVLMRSLVDSKSIDEFIRLTVFSVLRRVNARRMAIGTIDSKARLSIRGSFGFSDDAIRELEGAELGETAMGVSLMRHETLEIGSAQDPVNKYSKVHHQDGLWSIVFPFEARGTVLGVCWIFFDELPGRIHLSALESDLVRIAGESALVRSVEQGPRALSNSAEPLLTEREHAITTLIRAGYSNKQIARRLHISESWVKKLNQAIFQKLGIKSRLEISKVYSLSDSSTST